MIIAPRNVDRQRGAALLVLFFAILTVSATVFLSSVNTHSVEMRRFDDVRMEMEKAKQALIAYALNYHLSGYNYVNDAIIMDEGPGRLLCPDVNNDGQADSTAVDCTDNVRGRLPESYTFSGNLIVIDDTYADIDQQFWYVVSPAFKEIATTQVNGQTVGNLSIDGVGGYAAVIIAPGEALSGQNRAASQTAVANYLEQGNVAGTAFVNSYPANPDAFNDQVIGIKASELTEKMLEIHGAEISVPSTIYNPMRVALNAYYMTNTALPANMGVLRNKGLGWRFDEGYWGNSITNFTWNSYPYNRYNLPGCNTYWYWFIPVSPYSPLNTYVSGTAC